MSTPNAVLLQHFDERLVSGSVVEASTDFVSMRIWHSEKLGHWSGVIEWATPNMRKPVGKLTSESFHPLWLARRLITRARLLGRISESDAAAFATHLGIKEP